LPRRATLALAAILFCAGSGTVHAAGAVFTTLLGDSYQSYSSAVTSDAQSNTYVAGMTSARDFPVTPGAYQTAFTGAYDAFLAKLGPDGKVVWATYLGGSSQNWATGVALDTSGNVWIAGFTASADFPLVNPLQTWPANAPGDQAFAFVSKFSPDGTKLLYSTLLGSTAGGAYAAAAGIAVDSAGNAYAAVNVTEATGYSGTQNAPDQTGIFVTKLAPQGTLVYSYFHPNGAASAIALDSCGAVYVAGSSVAGGPTTATLASSTPVLQQAIVFKLSPDGSTKLWETALGSSAQSAAAALAVDSAGEVWMAGSTSSANFPLVHPLQNTLGERPLVTSANYGATWMPIDNLPFALPLAIVVDPATPTTLYAATSDLGIFKSVDGGATWTAASNGIAAASVSALAIDPVHTQTLYAGASTAVYKSVDGANTWTAIDFPSASLIQILVDAQNPNNIYEVLLNTQGIPGTPNFRKSTDGGATWNTIPFAHPPMVTLALDPRVSGHLFAVGWENLAQPGSIGVPAMVQALYTSIDGGATWTMAAQVNYSPVGSIVVDASTNPSTVYCELEIKSADGGVSWSPLAALPGTVGPGSGVYAVDPTGTLYALGQGTGTFVSHDHAQTWTPIAFPGFNTAAIVPAGSSGTLYSLVTAGNQSAFGTAGFVSKISADGSTLEYSTYLRGHQSAPGYTVFNEPALFETQNWIAGIALDSAGDAIVTGGTRATDFPTANPLQSASAGLADAFAAVISADGSTLKYSTYLGGSSDDGGLGVSLDPQGNLILAGETWSGNFPTTNGPTLGPGAGGAFVAKMSVPTTPIVTSVLNGASFLPDIEAGSWATIMGSNLANITRAWQASDFVGNNLPEQLSGVSVTIDGEPAFVSYISPTQINVVTPSDAATGPVNVVVNNNGMLSAPAPAQLQTYAPAFFIQAGTTLAFASLLPDYAPITGSAPAHPGDLIVLWGTGFGPTTPPAPAGVIVSGVPVAPTPTVTVGGVSAPVLSSVLTAGSAGLYQVTIQLPANVPTGSVAIQASVGGVQTPAGATILIGKL
jgi:uncharacterized protein (TIGR03437 family)